MSGRRVARPAETEQTGPGRVEAVVGATRGDLSGLRSDLLRFRGPSTEATWRGDGPAWQPPTSTWSQGAPTLWVEDPVSAPGAHGPVGGDSLHPDDLAVLHGLPEPERAPEPSHRPTTRAQRRETHRGSAEGLSLWSDPEEDAPDREPAPRAREDRVREERASAPRWAVVLAAVLALLVGAALTALVTEGQVRSARQETAESVAAAEDARESANQARIALQESEALTELTAPEPRDPEPFDEGVLQDGAAEDGAAEDGAATDAPARPQPHSTRATEERPRESAPAAGSSGTGSPDAAAPDAPPDQGTRPGRSAAVPTGSSEESAAADDAACVGDPAGEVDGATSGDGGDTCP